MEAILLACCLTGVVLGDDTAVRPDLPNEIVFDAREARFVRLVIYANTSAQPCIDELEVYAAEGGENLALASAGAKATASSCLPAHAIHQIVHLNDGRYGNDRSWIAASGNEEWAQIELPEAAKVARVVFSRDRNRQYTDRVPTLFGVELSADGENWTEVRRIKTRAAVVTPRTRPGTFAGVVPSPPPPPRLSAAGEPVPVETVDAKVPREDALGFANLALGPDARPAASSVISGYDIHKIEHLSDGKAGNDYSWISASDPSWAEIDLGDTYWIYKVAFGSDSTQQHVDRAAASFRILTAEEHNADTAADTWTPVFRQSGGPAVHVRREMKFKPVRARWVRIAVDASSQSEVRIEEIEVYGQKEPIDPEKIGPLPETMLVEDRSDVDEQLRYAFGAEEHAWLKTYGRADLEARLTDTPYREKRYPEHKPEDQLPLPPVAGELKLDGVLDDPCWTQASRGVARVADPYDFDAGPLVEQAVWAGRTGEDLLLAIRVDRLLSSHVAVVSTLDGGGCGVLAWTKDGLVFNTYEPSGRSGAENTESKPVEGAWDESLRVFEARLPLAWFPKCETRGIRVGLGMGGRHTRAHGQAVHFVFSRLAVAQAGPCTGGKFQVQLAAADGEGPITLASETAGLGDGVTLAPGQSKTITLDATCGAIGPELELNLEEVDTGETFRLSLFRYDPLQRTLALMDEMVEHFASRGLDVSEERNELAALERRHAELLAHPPDLAAERKAFFDARLAKRRLFFREPDLTPIGRILFVKRQAFQPSHNYSVLLDSAWRPGGGVCTLEIPRVDGRFEPSKAKVTMLFDSQEGIARNPMANFDATKVYFGYRPSKEEYFHIYEMNADGSGVKELTSGPFHDYWPCPLPDGGLAFISTRCRCRFLCWRPQTAVLFRMDADGGNMRPLSFSNLTEWGPSVMRDGRIIWQRSEYQDKGADYSHTLWAVRPDGTKPELIFGNTILLPQGYANGREVPGTHEISATLISHFGDLNGPIALLDMDKGRFNPHAITSITPEVPWPGYWPNNECFRDPVPIATDYFLVSHAPRDRFALYVIDRHGNRELLYLDASVGSMCPTPLAAVPPPPVLKSTEPPQMPHEEDELGVFAVADVYQGIEPAVERGRVKYIRVAQEVRANLLLMPDGTYQKDHEPFMHWYATPVDRVRGPYGWPSYVAKGTWGLAPVEQDGSAHFYAPAGKVLYFQVLDENYNELQRMRSVVQLQPGETRSCVGCHDDRRSAPPAHRGTALLRPPSKLQAPPWGAGPFCYEDVIQPVLDKKCVSCHDAKDERGINLAGTLDFDRVPASYRTLISQGWVHHFDWGYKSGENGMAEPLTFGTLKSKLFPLLDAGHYDVVLTEAEMRALKCWVDLNCPLWPDYQFRDNRPGPEPKLTKAE